MTKRKPRLAGVLNNSSLRGTKCRSNLKNKIASPSARNDTICVSFMFLLFTLYSLLFSGAANADTITTKGGKEIKGIMVEDYKDRVIFSTVDGEVNIMKSDIAELYFDSEEDNLIKLAEQAQEKNDYGRAFGYYDKAYKLNPNSKRAKDGLVFLQSYLFRKGEANKEMSVRRQEDFEKYGSHIEAMDGDEGEHNRAVEKLKDTSGMAIGLTENMPGIVNVRIDSPAYEAGIRRGDTLAAIWGRLTGYMSLQEVVNNIMEKSSLEVKCVIERVIDVPIRKERPLFAKINSLIGASFSMEFDGLTISGVTDGDSAALSGIRKGDLIAAIDDKSTRYMPLKNAVEMIKRSKANIVKLTIRREATFWRSA